MKVRPLKFVNENFDLNKETDEINSPAFRVKQGLIKSMFDDVNETIRDNEVTVLTPSKHHVYVEDTPVSYYGLSITERRKKDSNAEFFYNNFLNITLIIVNSVKLIFYK